MAHADRFAERRRKYRFPIYSFQEIASMSPSEWELECRLNGCDMAPHPEEVAAEEIAATRGGN
jgi:hypothetical protein